MSSNPPEFDWSQAESLLGDEPNNVPEDMADIVLELVQSSEQRFEELKRLKPETERPAIASQAHQLRGSLLNFGFVEVGTLLLFLEKREFPADDYLRLVNEAQEVFRASTKMLGERYPCLRLS